LIAKNGKANIDISGVKHIGKEFAPGELEAAAMQGDTTELAVADMVERAKDRHKWLVFSCGIKHAAQIAESLQKHGIETGIITGDMPSGERSETIAMFKGERLAELRCLVNVNVLTTGFNVPAIDMIAFMRPTESASLYVQMAGRGMRKSDATGKTNCLILDYAGNCLRHGPIDAVNPDRKTGSGDGIAPAKECPKCTCIIHAAIRVCPYCGYEFPKIEIEVRQTPSEAPILKKEIVPECVEVLETEYEVWQKPDKKPSVKITYRIGEFDRICEWIFPESGNQAGAFYYGRFCAGLGLEYPYPKTAAEFVDLPPEWMQASKIWTIPDGKYTRVTKREYKDAKMYIEEAPF
jgi:DNA repair protein RadD